MKAMASVSLDLDNQWSYMKTHGDDGWESYPSYFDRLVPRVLDFLKQRDMKITFFVVGQDAAREINHEAIRSIASAGHEIGNHSYNHEPWLHLYSRDEIENEIGTTENLITDITGRRPIGFRGPGYSLSPTVLEVLSERGYQYDCSTLPTYIGPLARAYYFFKSPEFTDDEREKRKGLFGRFSDGLQSLRPYSWQVGESSLVEIPVTTFPIVKFPIHASYVIYLSTISEALARIYWWMAVETCRLTRTPISLLLHPLDFLSGEDVPELMFFPGMSMPAKQKMSIVSEMLETLGRRFELTDMRGHAQSVRDGSKLAVRAAGSKLNAEA